MKKTFLILIFLLADFFSCSSERKHVSVSILGENEFLCPGTVYWVLFNFAIEKGWHIYWKNPGDSGLPVRIKWELPEGLQDGEILWPQPQRIETSGIINFVYFEETELLVPIYSIKNLSVNNVKIKAKVDWLECNESCIPGNALLELSLEVKNYLPVLKPDNIKIFQTARSQMSLNSKDNQKAMN